MISWKGTYGVSWMTSDEKLQIIKRWCHWFDIESAPWDDGTMYGQIWLYPHSTHPVVTKYYEDKSTVINEAYHMVNEYVWGIVRD